MRLSAFCFFAFLSTNVLCEEKLLYLFVGPGSTLTENKCKICHELQHIRRTPLSRGEWADNLKNMKERGTPMTEAEQALILDYLSVYYNREKPAPAPSPDTLAGVAAIRCSGCSKRAAAPRAMRRTGAWSARRSGRWR